MATLLETDAVLKRGVSELALADPVMAKLADNGITPQLRRRPPGFEGLAWIVIGPFAWLFISYLLVRDLWPWKRK